MTYRCQTCKATVTLADGQPRPTYAVRRDGAVVRELAVCAACAEVLAGGKPVASLLHPEMNQQPTQETAKDAIHIDHADGNTSEASGEAARADAGDAAGEQQRDAGEAGATATT